MTCGSHVDSVPDGGRFVALRGGDSHTPQEDADEQDIEHAALVALDVPGSH